MYYTAKKRAAEAIRMFFEELNEVRVTYHGWRRASHGQTPAAVISRAARIDIAGIFGQRVCGQCHGALARYHRAIGT